MHVDHRIESVEPLDDGRHIRLAFRNPKRTFVIDLIEFMDGSDQFIALKDPKIFNQVKPVHYNFGLQWGGDEMLEVGGDTMFRMGEAQEAA